jgi:hypothetical protein
VTAGPRKTTPLTYDCIKCQETRFIERAIVYVQSNTTPLFYLTNIVCQAIKPILFQVAALQHRSVDWNTAQLCSRLGQCQDEKPSVGVAGVCAEGHWNQPISVYLPCRHVHTEPDSQLIGSPLNSNATNNLDTTTHVISWSHYGLVGSEAVRSAWHVAASPQPTRHDSKQTTSDGPPNRTASHHWPA